MKRCHLRTEVRREQIARAALKIVVEEGVRLMTVERVARSVGLAPSALYRHYSGKMELLDSVVEMLREEFRKELGAVAAEHEEPLAGVHAVLMTIADNIGKMQAIPRMLFSDEVFKGKPEHRAMIEKILGAVREIVIPLFEEGQCSGIVRTDISAEMLAVHFIGLYIPCGVLYNATMGEFDVHRHIEANWNVFVKGLAP